ncbi:MAG: circularly permuted type 2 ATP-grasp protein, partial [Methylocella sp.]
MSHSAADQAKADFDAAGRMTELAAGYKPLPGIPDEFIGADGRPRAHWLRFLAALMELSADDIGRRFATADRHIRDTGVSYRAYGDTSERAWPLSHVPLLIEAGEWREIAQGIEQRARLMELVLADIYGEGRLITAGELPAAAV